MMVDLGWIVGWSLAGIGAYLGGAPFIMMVAGIFISQIMVLIAVRREMPKMEES